jgi:hypothetical protein
MTVDQQKRDDETTQDNERIDSHLSIAKPATHIVEPKSV